MRRISTRQRTSSDLVRLQQTKREAQKRAQTPAPLSLAGGRGRSPWLSAAVDVSFLSRLPGAGLSRKNLSTAGVRKAVGYGVSL
jgi:hypothetical protein